MIAAELLDPQLQWWGGTEPSYTMIAYFRC